MKHNNNIVQQIKDRASIIEIVSKYVQLTQKGNRYWGLSPFKAEKTPSFTVNPEKNMYYCFSTSQGGDIFDFIMKLEQVDFKGALRILAQNLGIDISQYDTKQSIPVNDNDTKTLELCRRISATFEYLLNTKMGNEAKAYLRERNLSEEIIKTFHLGYSPQEVSWLHNFLSKKGYTQEQLQESGLFSKNYNNYPLFVGRLIFPISTISGQVIGFGGRILQGEGPKYINSPETKFYKKKNILYGLRQCIQSEGFKSLQKAYLVEGYFDVIAMHEAGITSTVAPLGTAFTKEQAQIIKRYTNSIVLVLDNDEAGFTAAIKSSVCCEQVGFKTIKIVELSEKDPSDILCEYSKAELCEQLNNEHEFFDYYLMKVLPSHNSSMEEKEAVIQGIGVYLNAIQSPYKKAFCIAKVADLFQISEQSITEALQDLERTPYRNTNTKVSDSSPSDEEVNIKRNKDTLAMVALCSEIEKDVSSYEKLRNSIHFSDVQDSNAHHILSIIENEFRQGTLSFSSILEHLSEPYQHFIELLLTTGEVAHQESQILHEYIVELKLMRLIKRSNTIDHHLRVQLNNNSSIVEQTHTQRHMSLNGQVEANTQIINKNQLIQELLEEKKFLNDEIIKLKNTMTML